MNKSFSLRGRRLFTVAFLILSVIAIASSCRNKQDTGIGNSLQQLGGYQCLDESAFTCLTLEIPLDHFKPNEGRVIDVTFAVLPAAKPNIRKGMLVVATGGPGVSGVLSADYYVSGYDQKILDQFDIVFFDQRGTAFSGNLACPQAATTYYRQHVTIGADMAEALKKIARTFSADCVKELSNPDLLPYLGTAQVVEDLEYFRKAMGDEKLWLYGESYGTQFAQTYAAKFPDHLAGLILDGTVDVTVTGLEYYEQQAKAFNETLISVFDTCDNDLLCKQDVSSRISSSPTQTDQKTITAYDTLLSRLRNGPVEYSFPLPSGGFEKRVFTLGDLEFVAASQLYGEGDRMMLARAVISAASDMDLVPLARLSYLNLGIDPQTLEIIPDPSYSDAVYYGVECQDYGYSGASSDERANNYLVAGNSITIPRFKSIIYADLPCAYWPSANSDPARPAPIQADGIPVLILGATADPVTPLANGRSVYHHLENAFLIITNGGPHVTFGYGNPCPDLFVTDFLILGKTPSERETICEGTVMNAYVPLAPSNASSFTTMSDAFTSIETEIAYLPEFYYWDGYEPLNTGCPFGGTIRFESTDTSYSFDLSSCAFSDGFAQTGTGTYDPNQDLFTLKVATAGYWTCDTSTYSRSREEIVLTGMCNGESVQIQTKWASYKYWETWKQQHPLLIQ